MCIMYEFETQCVEIELILLKSETENSWGKAEFRFRVSHILIEVQ